MTHKPVPAYLGEYRILCQVGEGTYGKVFRALHRTSNKTVALKVLFLDNQMEEDGGISVTALREIKYLQHLAGRPNIVQLVNSFFTPDKELVLVFEYMENDLSGLSSHPDMRFNEIEVKYIMKQILEGLYQMHSSGVMHRDIKAANLLLGKDSVVKIADFGLATDFFRRHEFSTNVVTLWYRAPELLLGMTKYGPKVDVWSAGCIFVELLEKLSPFPGKTETQQMELIFKLCGTPNEHTWPGVSKLPEYKKLSETGKGRYLNKIDDIYGHWNPKALDLLKKMLTPDPEKRISATDALDHDYFWSDPLPPPAGTQMKFVVSSVHEYELKCKTAKEEQLRQQYPHGNRPINNHWNNMQPQGNMNRPTAHQRLHPNKSLVNNNPRSSFVQNLHSNGVRREIMKKTTPATGRTRLPCNDDLEAVVSSMLNVPRPPPMVSVKVPESAPPSRPPSDEHETQELSMKEEPKKETSMMVRFRLPPRHAALEKRKG